MKNAKMKNTDTLLSELGEVAREESPPTLDVQLQILNTIATQQTTPKLDFMPIALSSLAVTVAAMFFIACFPSWQTMFDPWSIYFTK